MAIRQTPFEIGSRAAGWVGEDGGCEGGEAVGNERTMAPRPWFLSIEGGIGWGLGGPGLVVEEGEGGPVALQDEGGRRLLPIPVAAVVRILHQLAGEVRRLGGGGKKGGNAGHKYSKIF